MNKQIRRMGLGLVIAFVLLFAQLNYVQFFAAGDIAGLLRISGTDSASLLVKRRYDWTADVERSLAAARQKVMLEDAGLQPQQRGHPRAPAARLEGRPQRSRRHQFHDGTGITRAPSR